MKCVIVTGATGFVGLNLVTQLSENYKVFALFRDNSKVDLLKNLPNVTPVLCDMNNIKSLPDLLANLVDNSVNYFAFFHLAWQGSAGVERENYDIHLDNIKFTCQAVEIAAQLNCEQFVYAGSLMEFESTSYIPIQGSKPARNYIYRTAKLTAHYMAKSIATSLEIPFKMGIISNAYGAGETAPRLINTSLRKLLAGEKTSFTPGVQLYDFIYITDVATAFIKIMEQGKPFYNYYIGNKKQYPLHEFITKMGACIDPNIDLGIGEVAFDGVAINYDSIDTNSLFNDTDFIPKIPFETGIKLTIDWIKLN